MPSPTLTLPSAPGTRRTFLSLQAGRGIAAVMVVFFHIGSFMGNDPTLWHSIRLYHAFYAGLYGVDYFFILSGIVMLSAHWRDMGKPARTPRYLWKRFRRIYPIYWVFLVPTVIKQLRVQGTHGLEQRNPFVILSSFLLVHIHTLGVNLVVSWTLFHEVLFYAVFATLLINKKLGIVLCTLWFAGSFFFFTPAAFAVAPDSYLQMLFSPLHLLFAFGMLLGWILQQRRGPVSRWLILLGAVAFFGCLAFQGLLRTQIPILRIAGDAGLALAVLTLAERESRFSMKIPRFLCILGDASYSIYLSHFMVVWAMASATYKLDRHLHLPLILWVAVLFAAAIAVGLIAHFVIERPLLKLLGDRTAPAMQISGRTKNLNITESAA